MAVHVARASPGRWERGARGGGTIQGRRSHRLVIPNLILEAEADGGMKIVILSSNCAN